MNLNHKNQSNGSNPNIALNAQDNGITLGIDVEEVSLGLKSITEAITSFNQIIAQAKTNLEEQVNNSLAQTKNEITSQFDGSLAQTKTELEAALNLAKTEFDNALKKNVQVIANQILEVSTDLQSQIDSLVIPEATNAVTVESLEAFDQKLDKNIIIQNENLKAIAESFDPFDFTGALEGAYIEIPRYNSATEPLAIIKENAGYEIREHGKFSADTDLRIILRYLGSYQGVDNQIYQVIEIFYTPFLVTITEAGVREEKVNIAPVLKVDGSNLNKWIINQNFSARVITHADFDNKTVLELTVKNNADLSRAFECSIGKRLAAYLEPSSRYQIKIEWLQETRNNGVLFKGRTVGSAENSNYTQFTPKKSFPLAGNGNGRYSVIETEMSMDEQPDSAWFDIRKDRGALTPGDKFTFCVEIYKL